MTHKPRIYQLLRQAGVIRTHEDAIRLFKAGKVLVNGRPVFNPEFQVNPKKKPVVVDGKPLILEIPKKYFVLNKPAGYLSTIKPVVGRSHVMELLKVEDSLKKTLFPVGRLDYETTGLMIVTNDGGLAHRVLRPEKKVEKEYRVVISGELDKTGLQALESGVAIQVDGQSYTTQPAKVSNVRMENNRTELTLVIKEGKKRQIRLMIAALGHVVLSLQRVRIGGLTLGNLAEGEYRELSKEEMVQKIFG